MILAIPEFLRLSLADFLDIFTIGAIIWLVFNKSRGSSVMSIFLAILLLLITRIIAEALGMNLLSSLLGTLIDVGAIAMIVIFQPEIRRFLMNLGRTAGKSLEKHSILSGLLGYHFQPDLHEKNIAELAEACFEMGASKTGALIVLKHNDSLEEIINTGDKIDAEISKRLIMNLFFKNSPLHDGAVIISGNRISAARCTLPISDRTDMPASYGMRHKAAMGLSEQSDADIIIVSEQNGKLHMARGGKFIPLSNINQLKLLLAEKDKTEEERDERRKD
ncbi:MAG: diadenylate cyclase [Bacteroidales bacterium]|nr:diadenylate cyclase [Bacteroidales bacterium]